MIPKTFEILGSKVKIKVCKVENHAGLYYHDEKLIEISEDLSKEQQVRTLMHELWHHAMYSAGLHQTSISHDCHEILAELFATVVCENFTLKKKR